MRTCKIDNRRIRDTDYGHVVPHAASILWIADECVGVQCGCGYDEEDLVLGIYLDMTTECPGCECQLFVEIEVKVMRLMGPNYGMP